MANQHASLETIEDFLAQERMARAGIWRNPASFSAMLAQELCRRGYEVVPAKPNAEEVQGRRCFARVQDIRPAGDGVLLMTSPEATENVVNDCREAGNWAHLDVSGNRQRLRERKSGRGLPGECDQVVPGECPFMFLPDAVFVHRVHGLINKVTGHDPRRESSYLGMVNHEF